MTRKRKTMVAGLAVLGVAAGAGGAVAATGADEARQHEAAVLGDAAKRLDVSEDELRSALAAAQAARLAADVKAGRLTQEQADAVAARRRADGLVLGHRRRGGRRGGPGGRGLLGGPEVLATALGIDPAELRERLRDGDSVADVAEAEGRSLESVRGALRAAARERLDAEVRAGRMTTAHRAAALEHLEERLERLDETRGWERGRHGGPPPAVPGG